MQSDIKDNAADFDLKALPKNLRLFNSLTTTFVLCSVRQEWHMGKQLVLQNRNLTEGEKGKT